MSAVLSAVERLAARFPERAALFGDKLSLSYEDLWREIGQAHRLLAVPAPRSVALMLDNGPAWAVIDLAVQRLGVPLVPLPAFFSTDQVQHALRDAAVDLILTDTPLAVCHLLEKAGIAVASEREERIAGERVQMIALAGISAAPPAAGVAKLSYTSGTTGAPKGVCLRQEAMEQVAHSLVVRVQARSSERHLSLLPLAVLLENVGGVYAPLLAGGSCCLPSLQSVGAYGAANVDIARLHAAMTYWQPSSAILVPQMLQALVELIEEGAPPPARLRLLAVGGAPVSVDLLRRAEGVGLPVYEGYGLSECASVVALNGPGQRRRGSVGRPLSHARVRIDEDGEILVAGALFSGYLGAAVQPRGATYLRTGDLGYVDGEGYLYLQGRKKHIFVTSYGRNVAPEWAERELTLRPAIAQAAVFGEGRPWNTAVIVPRASDQHALTYIENAVSQANAILPDYARIAKWILADAPFSPGNGELTASGRIRRQAVWSHYGSRIEKLYFRTGAQAL